MVISNQHHEDLGWHSAIIMYAGHLSIESFFSKQEAIQHLRAWYAGLLADQDPDDRSDLIAEFGKPTSITVKRMCDFFAMEEEHLFWCDVVPAENVLSRICPTLMDTHRGTPHAAIVLTDGIVEAKPCHSYDQALSALRERAGEWDLESSDPDPTTASVAQLSMVYGEDEPAMWIGIMPIISTPEGPAVLVPLDRLPRISNS